MSLPSLKETIAQYQLGANKKLGQHFLTDAGLLTRIVEQAVLSQGVHAIEIGPGPGGLTRALLASPAATVTALELDERCLPILQTLQIHDERLHVIHGDAKKHTLTDLCPSPRAVVANLPYNVGTHILIGYLRQIEAQGHEVVESITVMLQQEVALRIAAPPNTTHYGRLSVLCQWLCEVDHCFDVPPEAFSPPPKVMSSVIRMVPRQPPVFRAEMKQLEHFLTCAFGQRRKMLRKSLKSWREDAQSLLERADIDPTRRAETLSLEEIGTLLSISH